MRRVLGILALVALLCAVGVGLRQAGAGGDAAREDLGARFDLAGARRALAGAPPALAAVHDDANELLPGGRAAFERRLRSLRGHPVVVNKWASWCRPCQVEFPFFQSVGTRRGREVAFLGVDSDDVEDAARTFLRDHPVPFPSYIDRDKAIARRLEAPLFPTTVFLDARGETAYVHQGQYRSAAELERDLDHYLGSAP